VSRSLVAFRTHYWNSSVEKLAEKLRASSTESDFVILVDETAGMVPIDRYDKVSHTRDFSEYFLPNHIDEKLLWICGDYALYALRRAKPNYDLYVMSEHDVSCNIDLGNIINGALENEVDLIAQGLEPAPIDWCWRAEAAKVFANPMKAFFPFMMISSRAIDYLFRVRLAISRKYSSPEDVPVINYETFIPTTLHGMSGFRFSDLSNHVNLPFYWFEDGFDIDDPISSIPGSIVHPVLGSEQHIEKYLERFGVRALMNEHEFFVRRFKYTNRKLLEEKLLNYMPRTIGRFEADSHS
jgi:hypothetical protein